MDEHEHNKHDKAAKRIQRWYRQNHNKLFVNDINKSNKKMICPITQSEIIGIPFIMKSSNKLVKYQADVLAEYFVTTYNLKSPVDRTPITFKDAKRLDLILKLNKFNPRYISNNYDNINKKYNIRNREQFKQRGMYVINLGDIFKEIITLNISRHVLDEKLYRFELLLCEFRDNDPKKAKEFSNLLITILKSLNKAKYKYIVKEMSDIHTYCFNNVNKKLYFVVFDQ